MNSDFDHLRKLLHRSSGLALDADKAYLAESRLRRIMTRAGIDDLGGLVKQIEGGRKPALMRDVVEAMTTNETFFFRDRLPFEHFKSYILPQLIEARSASRSIRIWCAACATGQEPYSLAMILDEEAKKLTGWNVEILATDLSRSVVDTAREALYSQFEVQRGLPINYLLRYFHQEGSHWRLSEHVRSRVKFQEFNLLSDPFRFGQFDIVFCRNVLIYFDPETKKQVLHRLANVLAPDGYLVMGAAETVVGLTDAFMLHPEFKTMNIHRPESMDARAPLKVIMTL
jgi:chemotaxis protein methyltransferase CheR